jgi:hypothetical protein
MSSDSMFFLAIFCRSAPQSVEVDPRCVSYLVANHGSRWIQQRMALSSIFGGVSFGLQYLGAD